jgi:hypothetical protein
LTVIALGADRDCRIAPLAAKVALSVDHLDAATFLDSGAASGDAPPAERRIDHRDDPEGSG